MAAAPLGLFVIALVLAEALDTSDGLLADVAGNWLVGLAFGSVLFVPAMLLTLCGGLLVPRSPHSGRVLATIGMLVLAAPGIVGVVESVIYLFVDRPEYPDDGTSWVPKLSTAGAIICGTPFVLISIATGFALRALWWPRATDAAR